MNFGRNQTGRDHDALFERALDDIQNESPDPAVASASARRVWERLSRELPAAPAASVVGRIHGCADFQALMPAFRDGTLPPARAVLLQDHVRECVQCRKVLQGTPVSIAARRTTVRRPWSASQRIAVAAMLLVSAGVAGWLGFERFGPAPEGSRATVASVSGGVFRLAAAGPQPVAPGQELAERDVIRTGNGARAVVLLRDGSRVEMGERAEFSVSLSRRDTTVHLDRGSIIVQAAKRRTGHLYVAAQDCRVSVTGTVFSVNSGTKGSRVSVIEGEVRVAQAQGESVLHPGDQVSTSASLGAVPIPDEIAWSQNRDEHVALLRQFAALQAKLQSLPMPGLRTQSRLLGFVPQDTVVYAAVPNLGSTLAEAHRLFEQQVSESDVLRRWVERSGLARNRPTLAEVVERVRSLSEYLGDEVVLAMADGDHASPLVLAEVRRPGLRQFLDAELQQLGSAGQPRIRILDGPVPLAQPGERQELLVLLRPQLLAVAVDLAPLQQVAARIDGAPGPGFEGTPFHARLTQAYQAGAGMLFAADLERVTRRVTGAGPNAGNTPAGQEALRRMGVADLRHLVVEQKQVTGQTQNLATVSFAGPRRGIASWLGDPGPMGTLDFISPNAHAAGAFIVKSPALMVDDVLAYLEPLQPAGGGNRTELESELGFRLRDDLAASLGGEIAFALDGPLLPTPSWRLAVEVNQPSRLQQVLQAMVEAANRAAARHGRQGVTLLQETVGSQTFYRLQALDATVLPEFHYTFVQGYLVAAPSRPLLQQALQTHRSGESLARSARFTSLLPNDRQVNVSAVVFQDVIGALGSLAQGAAAAAQAPDLASSTGPSLLCAYGEPDRIVVVTRGGGLFGLGLNGLFSPSGLAGLFGNGGFPRMAPRANGTTPARPAY